MQQLWCDVGIVTKTDEGVLVALVFQKGVLAVCHGGKTVPLFRAPTLLCWLEGPEAAYVESMEKHGELTAVVFDFGEDVYRIATSLAQWSTGERSRLSDRSNTAPVTGGDAPF